MTFEQLVREHDHIDILTMRLETCCAAPKPDVEAVVRARSALRETLEDHLEHEDGSIYPVLMRAGGRPAEAITHFAESFAALRADWGNYLLEWDEECLAVDWDNFCAETRALMGRVRERTRQESNLIYPMALQNGAIAFRAPKPFVVPVPAAKPTLQVA